MLYKHVSKVPESIIDILNENDTHLPSSLTIETINLRSPERETVLMTLDRMQLMELIDDVNIELLHHGHYFAYFDKAFNIVITTWDYGEIIKPEVFKPLQENVFYLEIEGWTRNYPEIKNENYCSFEKIAVANKALEIIKGKITKFTLAYNDELFIKIPTNQKRFWEL